MLNELMGDQLMGEIKCVVEIWWNIMLDKQSADKSYVVEEALSKPHQSNLNPRDKQTSTQGKGETTNKWLGADSTDADAAASRVESSEIGCKLYPDVIFSMFQLLQFPQQRLREMCCCRRWCYVVCLFVSNFQKLHRLTIKLLLLHFCFILGWILILHVPVIFE